MIFFNLQFAITYQIFLDGTTFTKNSGTNVWNMFNALPGTMTQLQSTLNKDNVESFTKDGNDMQSIYISGLASSTSLSQLEYMSQSINGAGIEKIGLLAYEFLVQRMHNNSAGADTIKIIGFSRGAATARMLCTYLSLYGITSSNLAPSVSTTSSLTNFEASLLNPNQASVVGKIPKIHFLGLFDTVAGLGLHQAAGRIIGTSDLVKMSMNIPSIVEICAHAVAINEVRADFQYTPINITRSWRELFFIGSHVDIGGFQNSNRQKVALQWMITQSGIKFLGSITISQEELIKIGNISPIIDTIRRAEIYGGVIRRSVDITRLADSVKIFANTRQIQYSQVTDTVLVESITNK